MKEPVVARLARAAADPGNVILDGFHALKHALRFGAEIEMACAVDPDAVAAMAQRLAPDLVTVLGLLVEAGDSTAVLGRRAPTGLAAVARRPAGVAAATIMTRRPIVLLDRPSFQGNVGAVVRVAAAADAAGVLVTGPVDPWNPAALRAAAGLHFALPVAHHAGELPPERPLIAIDPDGEPLGDRALPVDALLAFGAERYGLDPELLARAQRRVAIPMRAGVSSLNLATAVAVVLYAGGRIASG